MELGRQAGEVIKKIKGKYAVLSETTVWRGGRRVRRQFGIYATRAQAEHRLRQIEFFKHLKAGKRAGRR